MEQTLGKKISSCRKNLGLTQDQLAEQLGVTAQAVSKWENDQSCPDITMLPKLAGIFHISTDELLGVSREESVHHAQVVDEDDDEDDGVHIHLEPSEKGSSWQFKWDSGRKSAVLTAIGVLLVGGLLVCSKLFSWNADFWDILWPSALLIFGIGRLLSRFSFFGIGCSLFGSYFLLDNLHIWQLDMAGELVWPVIIVVFGLSLLVDALRKPKKPRFSVIHNGKNVCSAGNTKTKSSYTCDDESFKTSLTFGKATRRIEAARLESGEVHCAFGELTVDLSGCEEIADGCSIEANCAFGQLTFLIPAKYRVKTDSSTAFASFDIQGQPNSDAEVTIELEGNASFGQITVKYI